MLPFLFRSWFLCPVQSFHESSPFPCWHSLCAPPSLLPVSCAWVLFPANMNCKDGWHSPISLLPPVVSEVTSAIIVDYCQLLCGWGNFCRVSSSFGLERFSGSWSLNWNTLVGHFSFHLAFLSSGLQCVSCAGDRIMWVWVVGCLYAWFSAVFDGSQVCCN